MTDLVAELRRRSKVCGITSYTTSEEAARAYGEAADILEADPLYKAAPEMRDLLTHLSNPDKHDKNYCYSENRAKALLATLPKAVPT